MTLSHSTCCQATAVHVYMAVRPLTPSAFLSLPLWESGRAEHMLHVCTAARDNQKYVEFFGYHIARGELRYGAQFALLNQNPLFYHSCFMSHSLDIIQIRVGSCMVAYLPPLKYKVSCLCEI